MNKPLAVAQEFAPAPVTHYSLLERAIDKGASIEVIERMMDLADREQAKRAKQEFDRAMAAALADMPSIAKTARADRYNYETIQAVVEAVRAPLSRHGLAFRWRPNQLGNQVRVTCIVSHSSGHTEETSLEATVDGPKGVNQVQALGATVTYLQRYTLKAALGLAAGEDTDGRAAPPPEPVIDSGVSDKISAMIETAEGLEDLTPVRKEIETLPTGNIRNELTRKWKAKKAAIQEGAGE